MNIDVHAAMCAVIGTRGASRQGRAAQSTLECCIQFSLAHRALQATSMSRIQRLESPLFIQFGFSFCVQQRILPCSASAVCRIPLARVLPLSVRHTVWLVVQLCLCPLLASLRRDGTHALCRRCG